MSDGQAGGDGEESGERRGRGLRSSIETHSSAGQEHYLYEHGGDDDGYAGRVYYYNSYGNGGDGEDDEVGMIISYHLQENNEKQEDRLAKATLELAGACQRADGAVGGDGGDDGQQLDEYDHDDRDDDNNYNNVM